jgi:hypothetical protein
MGEVILVLEKTPNEKEIFEYTVIRKQGARDLRWRLFRALGVAYQRRAQFSGACGGRVLDSCFEGGASNGSLQWQASFVTSSLVSVERDVALPFRATRTGGGLKAAATRCPAMEWLSATHHTSAQAQPLTGRRFSVSSAPERSTKNATRPSHRGGTR